MIDLRSDTVTVPTPEMRRVIADAEVGDDVLHDDPTARRLEERTAEILGKEEAVYVPSGTMANQIAIRLHTQPGDIVLAAEEAHIHIHELGAGAVLSGIQIHQLPTAGGTVTADSVRDSIPDPEVIPDALFHPVTLVSAENTHNMAGGTVWDPGQLAEVASAAASLGLATHLDGARLWNAAAASGVAEEVLAKGFDTVSVCYSKALGAPMGSALAGTAETISSARRFKQMFGGGFRQIGLMAAGALHALEHHRELLAADHENASRLATALANMPGVEVDESSVQSNMVYFDLTDVDPGRFIDQCGRDGVALLAMGPRTIRVVCHFQVSATDVESAIKVIAAAARP